MMSVQKYFSVDMDMSTWFALSWNKCLQSHMLIGCDSILLWAVSTSSLIMCEQKLLGVEQRQAQREKEMARR